MLVVSSWDAHTLIVSRNVAGHLSLELAETFDLIDRGLIVVAGSLPKIRDWYLVVSKILAGLNHLGKHALFLLNEVALQIQIPQTKRILLFVTCLGLQIVIARLIDVSHY